jgi:uncharacterized protein
MTVSIYKTLNMKKYLLSLLVCATLSSTLIAQDLYEAVSEKNYDKVESILKSGGKVNKANKKGSFPLWIAVWNDDSAMVKLLLANGADARQRFSKGEGKSSCLEIASQNGATAIVRILVEAGVDINEKGYVGHTAFRIASRNGHTDIVKYLAGKGAEIDTKGDDEATPLESAAGKGHLEIVQFLVESGAKVNHQDKDRDTPLGEAAKAGFVDVVKYLLSKGADASLKNKDGRTAEDLAKISGHPKVADVLKGAGK